MQCDLTRMWIQVCRHANSNFPYNLIDVFQLRSFRALEHVMETV